MAPTNRSSSMFSHSLHLQVLFISIGILSTAVVLNLYFPAMVRFAAEGAPAIWNSLAAWLRPPYLYFVVNGIIITIAFSSRFQTAEDGLEPPDLLPPPPPQASPAIASADLLAPEFRRPFAAAIGHPPEEALTAANLASPEIEPLIGAADSPAVDLPSSEDRISDLEIETGVESSGMESGGEEGIATETPPARSDSAEILKAYESLAVEKPLVSSRIGNRKSIKSSSEGGRKALRRVVARPKRHETLENTWKMITEGRSMPLTRHLKKSDTWEQQGRPIYPGQDDPAPDQEKVKKRRTFKDRTNNLPPVTPAAAPPPPRPPAAVRLRKEPSLSQDELNRRVEAFIKKFNEEMRLQRQESLKRYYEKINRDAH